MQQKTKLMFRFDQEISQPIETPLPRLINRQGIADTAAQLGVSKATINYWMLKLSIPVQRTALMPDETIIVKRSA